MLANPLPELKIDGVADRVVGEAHKPLVEIKFDEVQFNTAVDFWRDVTGGNFVLDTAALQKVKIDPTATISVRLKDTSSAMALATSIHAVDTRGAMGICEDEGVVLISSAAGAAEHRRILAAHMADDKVFARRLPQIKFDAVALKDVFEFFRDITGAGMRVDWKSLDRAGLRQDSSITFRAGDISFGALLRLALRVAGGGADYSNGDGKVLITADSRSG